MMMIVLMKMMIQEIKRMMMDQEKIQKNIDQ